MAATVVVSRRIVTEIRAGRPRPEALRQFAERTKVEEVRSLVLTMIQTDNLGTSGELRGLEFFDHQQTSLQHLGLPVVGERWHHEA